MGKKLKEYDCPKDEVMVLGENVAEAQRQAIMDMKDYNEKKGSRGKKFGGKRSRDEMDQEEG